MEQNEVEQEYFRESMEPHYGCIGGIRDTLRYGEERMCSVIEQYNETSMGSVGDKARIDDRQKQNDTREDRVRKQKDLERQWRRTGCFSEANEALKWDYFKKTVFCGLFYENERERFDNDRLADHPYVKYMTYWGVWKKCMDRNNLLDKDNE